MWNWHFLKRLPLSDDGNIDRPFQNAGNLLRIDEADCPKRILLLSVVMYNFSYRAGKVRVFCSDSGCSIIVHYSYIPVHSFHSIQAIAGGSRIRHKANHHYFLFHLHRKRWNDSQHSRNWEHWKELYFTRWCISWFYITVFKPTGKIYFSFMLDVCEKGCLPR